MDLEVAGSTRTIVIITFLLYSTVIVGIGIYSKRAMDKIDIDKYVDEFYTGGRGAGALIVALMVAAGLCSAGTFIGGPGLAYHIGLAWLIVGFAQNFMNFTILGQLGKKVGIVARRINAQSFLDLILSRYNRNKVIGLFGVLSIVVFMGSYVTAQFVGGARLFETMTGLSYLTGLIIFAVVVGSTAIFGGIKGVALSIVIQGIVMTTAVFALLIGTIIYVGDIEVAYRAMALTKPELLTPWTWSPLFQMSMWVIFGIATVALPHGTMGALVYKNTKSMHSAIRIGVLFVVAWTLILPWIGHIANSVYPDLTAPDSVIPMMTLTVLPPWLAGLTMAGVAGAIQSTVGAMIIVISSTFVKDAYQAFFNPKADSATMKKVTIISTTVISLLIFVAAINPPSALEWIIAFAVGGLGSAFFWPLILGVYWKRVNEYGAAAGMIGGMATFIVGAGNYLPITMGMNAIVIGLLVSGALTIGVSLATPKPPKGIIHIWFGKHYSKVPS